MKRATVMVVVLCFSSCAPTTSSVISERLGIAPIPVAPPQFAGAAGLGVGARGMFANPGRSEVSGLGFPAAQFEADGVYRFAQGTSVGASVTVGPTAIATRQAPDIAISSGDRFATQAMVTTGHDFSLHSHFGLTAALEAGAFIVPVVAVSRATRDRVNRTYVLPVLAGGASFYGDFKYLRPWLGATVGTGVASDKTGSILTDCFIGCDTSEIGRTAMNALVMMSAGVSVRPIKELQINLELLVPLTEMDARIPVSGGISMRFDVFAAGRVKKVAPAPEPASAPPLIPADPDVPMTP